MLLQSQALEIRPITASELDAVLRVYQECEDFLALGPAASASMEMVVQDITLSRQNGGIFNGIFTADGGMIGVIDYIPAQYQGDPGAAFLELLMIAAPYRKSGIGRAVVEAVEQEIRKNPEVNTIQAGVQVNNPQAVHFWQQRGYRIVSGPQRMPDQTTVFGLRKDF